MINPTLYSQHRRTRARLFDTRKPIIINLGMTCTRACFHFHRADGQSASIHARARALDRPPVIFKESFGIALRGSAFYRF